VTASFLVAIPTMPRNDEPVNVGTTPTYKMDYEFGIMINYEVSREAIAPYIPAPLVPISLKMLDTDPEAKFYVSLYLARCGINDNVHRQNRADVFTYIKDSKGQLGMMFLSVLCEIPPTLPKKLIPKFMGMSKSLMIDSGSGKCTLPHMELDSMDVSQDMVNVKMGETLFESSFKVQGTHVFHNDFVLTNSQIYHSGKDRTINFFNQEFMSAPIYDIDLAVVNAVATEQWHPLCIPSNLASVQKYGNAENPIRWYFMPHARM